MPAIHLRLDGDHERVGREVGINHYPVIHTVADWTLDALEAGMTSGRTSVMLLIPANYKGEDVLVAAETSLAMWMMAATALAARFADEVEAPGFAKLSPAARAHLKPRISEAIRRAMIDREARGRPLDDAADEAAEMILDGFGADAPPAP